MNGLKQNKRMGGELIYHTALPPLAEPPGARSSKVYVFM